MAHAVPMVRAMALIPAVRWLEANGRSVESPLRAVGLASVPFSDPLRPVSLLSVGRLLNALAEAEGPDIPSRIVSTASAVELMLLGRVALGTRTPFEAIARIAAVLPLFCSHENLFIQPTESGFSLRHSYLVKFDAVTKHLMLQYASAMVDRLCGMTDVGPPRLMRVEMPPHPKHGVKHLRRWLGDGVVAMTGHSISIQIGQEIALRRFPTIARDRIIGKGPPGIPPLRGDGTFSSSAGTMIDSFLDDGIPSIEQLAQASGTSVRTLQRWLADERTTFSTLLDEVRRAKALRLLNTNNPSVGSVSTELGYARQSSLTRAVRRWTGAPPKTFRNR